MEVPQNIHLFAMVGMSGAGKSTLLKILLGSYLSNDLVKDAVSTTTRERRASEIEGKHYYFVGPEEFQRAIDADEFLEYEEVHGCGDFYGMKKAELEAIFAQNLSPIFDVDVHGALKLKKIFGDRITLIFIDGPKDEEKVRERLRGRGDMTEEKIDRRMATARKELSLRDKFDRFVDNSGSTRDSAIFELMEIILTKLGHPLRLDAFRKA
jgi:guanylate kinase